jgi:ribosome-associated protein
MPTLETRRLVAAAVAACEDKKAEDTRILELDPVDSGFTDFFIITSGTNSRQTEAISDEIEHQLKTKFGVRPNSVEGRRQGEWVLMDYVDFVVHVFLTEKRAFYDIERLRKSARSMDVAELKATLIEKVKESREKAASAKVARKAIKSVKTTKPKKVSATVSPAKKISTKRSPKT